MSFQRPTLTDLIDRALADLSSRVVGVDGAVLRRSVLGAIARMSAGAAHEMHGHLDYLARQVIIDTADAEHLDRWANVWGVRRKAASYATGSATFTGANGSLIPNGTLLQRQDGALFQTLSEATIAAGSATVPLRAQNAGSDGSSDAGVKLALMQPVSGVQSTATVAVGGLTGGADAESDDQLRARLLARIQKPPQGGADFDYEAWALEVPGVTRAWVSPREQGAGTVTVRFVRDDDASMIPDAAEVAAVDAYIQARRPVTAEVYVVAPIAKPLNLSIQIEPNTATIRAAIEAELRDMLRREGKPGGTILLSHINEAISIAPGEFDHVIVSPEANTAHAAGEIPVLGGITWDDVFHMTPAH